MEPQTETKTVAGDISQQDIKGKIVEFSWWMKKQGYKDGTILSRTKLLKIMVKRGANLYDPETIKDVIAKQSWSEGRKENAVNAYTTFLTMTSGTWNPPIYCRIKKNPVHSKRRRNRRVNRKLLTKSRYFTSNTQGNSCKSWRSPVAKMDRPRYRKQDTAINT